MPRTALASAIAIALSLAAGPAAAATAYVSNEKDDSISVINLDTMETVETLEVGMRPRGLTLSHDNKLLYICASASDTVQVMALSTRQIITQLPSGADPEPSALNPNTQSPYTPNEDQPRGTRAQAHK